jgi:hypothetical protein
MELVTPLAPIMQIDIQDIGNWKKGDDIVGDIGAPLCSRSLQLIVRLIVRLARPIQLRVTGKGSNGKVGCRLSVLAGWAAVLVRIGSKDGI